MKKLLCCVSLLLSSLSFATAINEDNFLTELESARFSHGAAVNSVAWIACGGKKYIAVGGDTFVTASNEIQLRLLEFDIFNNVVTEVSGGVDTQHDANVNSVAWLKCDDKKYLATVGVGEMSVTTRVYRFSESNIQLQQKHAHNNAGTTNSLAWIDCGESGKWLAEGAAMGATNRVTVRLFNTQTETLGAAVVGSTDHVQDVNSVAWCVANNKKFLAIGGVADGGVTTRLYVLDFDGGASLDLQTSANQMHGATIHSVDWVDCKGTKFLVTAGEKPTNAAPTVRIYKLDAGDTPALTEVATYIGDDATFSAKWLNCGGTKYLAFGNDDNTIQIFKFDPTEGSESLTEITSQAFDHTDDVRSVAWLQCGALTYLGIGGDTAAAAAPNNFTNRVFEVDFGDDATNKLLREKFFQLHGNNAPDVPFLNVEPMVIV